MKNKWIVAFAFLVLTGFSAQAQGFGLRGGFDLQNINGKDSSGDNLELSLAPRFNAGVVFEVPVAPDFFFQPGLLFSTKGAKSKDEFLGIDTSIDFNLGYIELPLSLLYKPVLGNGRFFLGFGPYIGYGITGKVKTTLNNVTVEEDVEWTKDYSGIAWNKFKPFDFGANIFFGYELAGGLSFQLNTQLGLAQINAENTSLSNDKSSWKNTGFGISLGYRF